MKNMLALLLTLCFLFSITGCADNGNKINEGNDASESTNPAIDSTVASEATEATQPTENPDSTEATYPIGGAGIPGVAITIHSARAEVPTRTVTLDNIVFKVPANANVNFENSLVGRTGCLIEFSDSNGRAGSLTVYHQETVDWVDHVVSSFEDTDTSTVLGGVPFDSKMVVGNIEHFGDGISKKYHVKFADDDSYMIWYLEADGYTPSFLSTFEESFVVTAPDGFGVPDPQPDKPIIGTMDDLPEDVIAGMVSYIFTDFGTVVATMDGSVSIYRDKVRIASMYTMVTFSDFFIDANTLPYETIHRWYGFIGNRIIAITDGKFYELATGVIEKSYSGNNVYAILRNGGRLECWSPRNTAHIMTEDISQVYTKDGYTFVQTSTEAYVVNASMFAVACQSQDYVNAHPITVIYLGTRAIEDYYVELDPLNGESRAEAADRFDRMFGTNLALYGE